MVKANVSEIERLMELNEFTNSRLSKEAKLRIPTIKRVLSGDISAKTGVPIAELYGIATFYAQFTLEPKGDYVVAVCQGTACYVKGAAAILDEVKNILGIEAGQTTEDGKFSIQDTRCLGCCGLAPVMTVNEDVYGKLLPSQVKDILAKY